MESGSLSFPKVVFGSITLERPDDTLPNNSAFFLYLLSGQIPDITAGNKNIRDTNPDHPRGIGGQSSLVICHIKFKIDAILKN